MAIATPILDKRMLMAFEGLCVIALGIALVMLPGAPRLGTLIGMSALGIAAVVAYRRMPSYARAGEALLVLVITALAVLTVANTHYYTIVSGGTDAAPVIVNPDLENNWNDALYYIGQHAEKGPDTHSFFAMVVAAFLWVGGVSVTLAMSVSVVCTVVTLLLTNAIAYRLSSSQRIATLSVLATACVCYLTAFGTVLIKEPMVIMAMAMAAYGICQWRKSSLAWVIAGAVFMTIARPNLNIAIASGVVICAFADSRASVRKTWLPRLLAIAIPALFLLIINRAEYSPSVTYQMRGVEELEHFRAPWQAAFYNIVGDDLFYEPLKRILYMPVFIVTQFLIPLPWTYARDAIYGPAFTVAHFGFPWYYFGAILIYYLCTFRRYANRRLLAVTLFGIFCWLIPCFTFMGVISRYGLLAVPLMAPAVATVLATQMRRRSLQIWLVVFSLVLVLTLAKVYNLQMAAM